MIGSRDQSPEVAPFFRMEKGRRSGFESFLPSKILRRKTTDQKSTRPKSYDFAPLLDTALELNRNTNDTTDSNGQCLGAIAKHREEDPREWNDLIGRHVCIGGIKEGILRYYGRTKFADGLWCGVELQEAVGKNDGTVNGVQYFFCKHNHGIFAPVTKVSLLSHDRLNNCVADQNFYRKQELPQHAHCSDLSTLKPSSSDSSFQKRSKSGSYSYVEEATNFLGDKRNITEQREGSSIGSFVRKFTATDDTTALPYVFSNHPSTSNAYALNKYVKHSMESTEMSGLSKIVGDHANFPRKIMSEYSLSTDARKAALTQSPSYPYTALKSTEMEHLSRASPCKTAQTLTRDRELDPKFNSSSCQPSFRSYVPSAEFFDFQDDNDDDQMSLDYDESLGILTPSEMKDFTLCAELPTTSRSDTRAVGFPSSESFDEVNDLPEDEQVHDVSVQYITSGSTSYLQSVALTKSNADTTYVKHGDAIQHETGFMKHTISTTDKFLTSISSTNMTDVNFQSSFVKDECRLPVNTLTMDSQAIRSNSSEHLNDVPMCTTKRVKLPEIPTSESCSVKFGGLPANIRQVDEEEMLDTAARLSPRRYDSNMKNRRNYETDSSRDSLLQNEEHTISKEKLTVSWEDRVTDSPDEMYSKIERPESVYTVGSSDTGYQEDGEFEPDTGMTTSLESSEGKRFSTFSRDSGAPDEDIDVDKVGESTSTSGYSTGLSDFCCNDRNEEGMCRPMEDSFQDVVDSCNSDDAMAFAPDSSSRDGHTSLEKSEGFFDMDSFKDPSESESDFHITESSTVLGLYSTCETLSETVIEDVTIVDTEQRSLETSAIQDIKDLDETIRCNGTLPMDRTPNIYTGGDLRTNTEKVTQAVKRQNIFNVLVPKKDPVQEISESAKKQDARSPRRNVMSKIKAVIGGNRSKSNDSTEQQQKKVSTPKKSRWEAVTSKIAASLAEEKTKVKVKKEIRSRVDTNLRQTCRSPRLDMSSASEGKGDISGASSASSKSRKIMNDRQRTLIKNKDNRGYMSRTSTDQGSKSPRPSKTRSSSRSTSPVAVSESSTSVSLTSHHSRSKIAVWKGSSSTVASSVAPTIQIKNLSAAALRTTCSSSRASSREMPKNLTAAKLRVNVSSPMSPRLSSSRIESSTKAQCTKLKSTKEQRSGGSGRPLVAPRPARPPMWLSKAELSQEIQHLSTLCEARTKELNRLKMQTRHATTGFDALAVVIGFMSSELNAFGNPTLATDLRDAQENLTIGKKNLEHYEKEIEKLNLLHVKEVNNVSNKFVKEHESKLEELIRKHTGEIAILTENHEKEARTLTEALRASCDEEKQQHQTMLDELQQELKKQREEMEIFHQHELDDLEERHLEKQKSLMMEIEKLRKQCEDAKVLSLNMEDALQKDTDTKLQWLSAKRLDLQNEVDSLKSVLEIKNNELHSLRKENLEMQKELEDLPLAREKIKMLQARAEDLQALMAEKVRLERQISNEHQNMKEVYEREEKINKRLSMENEELVWRLKQATESSLLSTSVPDEDETEEHFLETSDLSSSCPPAVFEPSSPAKSPKPMNTRPMFFTYMNEDELSARSPQSPRTQYKRIQPHKVSKSSSPSPHTSRRNIDSSPHTSEATPRKMARQISRNAKDMKNHRRGRDGSSETKRAGDSVPDSMLSSASSEASLFDPCLLEEHTEQISVSLHILQEQRSADVSSLNFTSQVNLSTVNANEGIDTSSEVFDPKSYYHMTFPVKDAAPDAEDAIKETVQE